MLDDAVKEVSAPTLSGALEELRKKTRPTCCDLAREARFITYQHHGKVYTVAFAYCPRCGNRLL